MPPRAPDPATPHVPVLLTEVLAALAPRAGGTYVDGTFGAGGYSAALLDAAACTVYGIDRDMSAIDRAAPLVARFAGRLVLVHGRYGDMDALLAAAGIGRVDGIALDLGVSSMQIDTPERGFSFRFDGPLDMRMGGDGETAADLVNHLPESALADVIFRFGEEHGARRVARAICQARAVAPLTRTGELAEVVRQALGGPRRPGRDGIDPATRTFQALRIAVNDELGELDRGLEAAERLLAPGGRLAVVSFHSLEDRAVKNFLRERAGEEPRVSRHLPDAPANGGKAPTFRLPRGGATQPGEAEARANPRARSARLRVAERTEAPAGSGRRAA